MGKRVENKNKVNLWNFKEWFHHDAIYIHVVKDKNKSHLIGIEYFYIH